VAPDGIRGNFPNYSREGSSDRLDRKRLGFVAWDSWPLQVGSAAATMGYLDGHDQF
jgi:hypothetical protein